MARNFNSTTDKVVSSSYSSLTSGGTIAGWVNASSTPNSYSAAVNQINASFFAIYIKSTGKAAYYVSANTNISVDPGSATISGWTHMAMSYDSTNGIKAYVNGVSDGTAAANGPVANYSAGLACGWDANFPTTRNLTGSVADAAEWNIVLTASEVAALAKGARPYQIRPSGLLCYLPLDGLQSPEPDLSGNARNGTVTGTALAFGPPIMQFTPLWPQWTQIVAAPTFNPAWARGKNTVIEGVAT